jgi:hypothetical protein
MNGNVMTVRLHGLRAGAVLVAAGIALSACGSSSSGGSGPTSPTSSAIASTSTSSASAAPNSNSSGLASGSSFCTYAKTQQEQAAKEIKAFESDSPKQLNAFVGRALSELQAFTSTAPAAIKADVAIAVTGDQKVFAALKKANYDYRDVSPTALESVDTPAFKRATLAIASYLESRCGITPSAVPTG